MRPLFLIALALAAAPALAQETEPLVRALAEIEAHRVEMRVGCSIPVPALWNAPPWEQRAAAGRRAGAPFGPQPQPYYNRCALSLRFEHLRAGDTVGREWVQSSPRTVE